MIGFIDSSALVKRYIKEEGREKVNSVIENASLVAVSRLAYPEVLSALMRRRATLNLTDGEFATLLSEFRNDWERLTVFDMDDETMQYVDSTIENHRLRGADSIHLSTAIWMKKNVSSQVMFVASDRELLAAARKERFKIINPQDSSLSESRTV
jgi:predicted nucleic acid-binding protein